MSGRAREREDLAERLAAIEGGELRAEDRRRFQRRSTDQPTGLIGLEAAIGDLRSRVGAAHKIRDELVAAREVVAALRDELRTLQAELSAERVASRRARMQAAWLQAELRRREETERHLRAALASLTGVLAAGGDDSAVVAEQAVDAVAAGERLAREQAERELRAARAELNDSQSPAGRGSERAAADTVAELRDALAELSGQGLLPAEHASSLADPQDFEAAAARLRARGSADRTHGQLTLAARGLSGRSDPWLRDGLLALAGDDPERAERLMLTLVSAQAGHAQRPLTYALAISESASYRVSVMPQGAAAGPASDGPVDGTIAGPIVALLPAFTGGGTRTLRGARVRRRRALRGLLSSRRRPLQLSELALLAHGPAARELLELAVLAISPRSVDRDALIDVACGEDVLRVICRTGQRPVVAAADSAAADATISVAPELLAAALAGSEDLAVSGDMAAVSRFLGWLDRDGQSG